MQDCQGEGGGSEVKDKQQITDVGVNWTTMAQFNLTWVNKIAANGKEITLMAATTGGTSCTIASEIAVWGGGCETPITDD